MQTWKFGLALALGTIALNSGSIIATAFQQETRTLSSYSCKPAKDWGAGVYRLPSGVHVMGLIGWKAFAFPLWDEEVVDKPLTTPSDGQWHICGFEGEPDKPPHVIRVLRPRTSV